MAADSVVSSELKSLQDELAAAQRERSPTANPAAPTATAAVEPAKETPEERDLHDQLSQLMDEVAGFFGEAEKNISAHPAQSVLIALAVGILIGRLLGRR